LQEFSNELNKIGKGSALPVKCDVSKEDEILAMFEEVNAKYGGVDVMINNAGLAHDAPMMTGKTEDWRNMLDVSHLYRPT
jgi:NAD(P)-dependent dehydrogenase (short-subunit alcohol dehydrogenase family)